MHVGPAAWTGSPRQARHTTAAVHRPLCNSFGLHQLRDEAQGLSRGERRDQHHPEAPCVLVALALPTDRVIAAGTAKGQAVAQAKRSVCLFLTDRRGLGSPGKAPHWNSSWFLAVSDGRYASSTCTPDQKISLLQDGDFTIARS